MSQQAQTKNRGKGLLFFFPLPPEYFHSLHSYSLSSYLEYVSCLRERKSLATSTHLGSIWTGHETLNGVSKHYFDDNYCLVSANEFSYLLNSSTGEILSPAIQGADFPFPTLCVLSTDETKLIWLSTSRTIKFLDLATFELGTLQLPAAELAIALTPVLFCTLEAQSSMSIFSGRSYVDGGVLWTVTVPGIVVPNLRAVYEGHDLITFPNQGSPYSISLLWMSTGVIKRTPIPFADLVVLPLTASTVVSVLHHFGASVITVQIYDHCLGQFVSMPKTLSSPRTYMGRWFLIGRLLFVSGSPASHEHMFGHIPDKFFIYDLHSIISGPIQPQICEPPETAPPASQAPISFGGSASFAAPTSWSAPNGARSFASFTSGHDVAYVLGCTRAFKFLYRCVGSTSALLKTSLICMKPMPPTPPVFQSPAPK